MFNLDPIDEMLRKQLTLTEVSRLFSCNFLLTFKPVQVISGDDDIPKRDDIGERRRKHELRVLAGAGIKTEDDEGEDLGFAEADGSSDEEDDVEDDTNDMDASEDEFYKQVKEKRAERLATKKQMYSRFVDALFLPVYDVLDIFRVKMV